MIGDVDKNQHTLPLEQPIVYLDAKSAFYGLSKNEKLYVHYLSLASWTGGLITFLQTSPESGPMFVLLHKLFKSKGPNELKTEALKAGYSEEEIKAFYVYVSGLLSNAGNYKGFGDTKFIPGISKDRLEGLLRLCPIWNDLELSWNDLKDKIYDLTQGRKCLGYPPQGCTTYFSHNFTEDDNKKVQEWAKKHNLELYNTRCFKTNHGNKINYEIRLAGVDSGILIKEEIDNCIYEITKGDYGYLMEKVSYYLTEAIHYAANKTERDMLKSYIRSFKECSLDMHKEGSRFWIKDKSPAVETYIGFIETYRDPSGVRGEFEGFVAVVNREMSAKFATLVDNAIKLLPLLPWTKDYEKDTFLKPDFTSLDVVAFAGSGIPAGINIPNYDDIRQTEGFKNVSLGNVIPASYQNTQIPFLSETDKDLLQKYRVTSFELQVGLHELLGHGSGKLLRKEQDSTYNFDKDKLLDPLTGQPPKTWYEPGDTYDSKFGPLSSPYEECRAECVGLYLSLEPSILEIFGHKGEQADDIYYVNWLALVWAGVCGLEMWEPGRGWLQAHSQARYVIAMVLIEAGVLTVTQQEPDNLLVTLNRESIKGAGRIAIGNFLLRLQVYKATCNVDGAKELFERYSEVKEPWIKWRDIVLANKRPRKMFAQSNTFLTGNDVLLKEYEASPEGLITSWIERFTNCQDLYDAIDILSKKDKHHFAI